MKKYMQSGLTVLVMAMVGVATNASAQEKSRAEVTQELVQAENNGLRFVTDTSYPEVNPIFVQQVAHLKQQRDNSMGSPMSGSSDSGKPMKSAGLGRTRGSMDACVGPAGFCTPYFGS